MTDSRRVFPNTSAGSSGFSCIAGSSVYFSSGGSRRQSGFTGARSITTAVLAIQALQMIGAPFAHAYTNTVNNGQTVTGETLNDFNSQTIESGGIANSTTVNFRGVQNVNSGGSSIGTIQNEGGNINVTVSGGDMATLINGTNASGNSFSYSSGVASGFIIYGFGGNQTVANGGLAIDTLVNSSGSQIVQSGGTATGTGLNLGGKLIVETGGHATGISQNEMGNIILTVSGGDTGTVVNGTNANGAFSYSGGVADNFIIYGSGYDNQGSQTVADGGLATHTVISGGSQIILAGGRATGTVIDNGVQVVSSGGTATDIIQNENGAITVTVSQGDTNTVVNGTNASGAFSYSGGVASNFIVNERGSQTVSSGGKAINTTVNSGGYQYVSNGGSAVDTIINNGGYQAVSEGGFASNVTINSNGWLNVSNGATINGITQHEGGDFFLSMGGGDTTVMNGVNASGSAFSYSGGTASGFILYSKGLQAISAGASALDTTINSGGSQGLNGGGYVSATTVNNGGKLIVENYNNQVASAMNLTQNEGGNIVFYVIKGGDNTVVNGTNASGVAFSYSGGTASNFIFFSGAHQTVSSGGSTVNTVLNGGTLNLGSTAKATGTTVNKGGTINLNSGGSATGTIQHEGGNINVSVTNGDTSTLINGTNASGSAFSYSGGTASNFILYDGGSQTVSSGGSAVNTIINSGGLQAIASGGTAIGIIQKEGGTIGAYVTGGDTSTIVSGINASGSAFSLSGGTASNFILYDGGSQTVSSGGSAVNTIINSGGYQSINSGFAYDTTVNAEGLMSVGYAGSAIRNVINGGTQLVDYGIATSTMVNDGGIQSVFYGGSATDTTVNAGGRQIVNISGVATATTVNDRGLQTVSSGGTASGTTVNAGGIQTVSSGGIVSDTTLNSGALQWINGGTIAGSATYNQGATLYAQGGSLSGGDMTFNGGTFQPELDISNTTANAFTVSGNVTGMGGATIAPVWTADTPLTAGTSASFLVLKTDGGTLDSTSGFGNTTKLVKATYSQRVESNNQLYLDVTGKKAGLQENYGAWMSPNAYNVAGTLDNADDLGVLPGVMTAIGNLAADGAIVNHAVDQLSPDVLPTAQLTGVASIRSFRQNLPTAFTQNGKQSVGLLADPARSSWKDGTTVFVNPYGTFMDQGSRHRYHGYDFNAGGFSFGAVHTLDNKAWLGAAAGYNHQKLDMRGQHSDLEANQAVLSLFGGKAFGSFVLEGGLGYAHSWNDTTRHASFSGYNAKNEGSFGQDFLFAGLNLSYVHTLSSDWRMIPSVGLDYVYAHSDSFTESGSDSALTVDSASYHSVEIPLAVRFDKTFKTKSGATVTPAFSLAWIPQVGDTYGKTTAGFVDASSAGTFETRSVSPGRNRGRASVGFDASLTDKWSFRLDYAIDVGQSYTGHNVFANFRKAF